MTDDKFAEDISTLIDNETKSTHQIDALKLNAKGERFREKWARYHLISDTIKGQKVSIENGKTFNSIRSAIAKEPRHQSGNHYRVLGLLFGAALLAIIFLPVMLNKPLILASHKAKPNLTAQNQPSKAVKEVTLYY